MPQAQARAVQQSLQPPSKMTLKSVIKGKVQSPTRTVTFGPEGCGKSTFAAGAPKPIFLGAEDGTGQLDIERLPQPETFADALEGIRMLGRETHDYGTIVIDTLDWLEPLIWQHICRRDEQANVESYGYGKGYQVALDEWRILLSALEHLRATKKMHVVLLAHSWIKPFKNPQGEDFDRYEMKLNAKASGLIKEWADSVLFANFETFAKKDERTKRVRGVSSGARFLHTERTAAFDAKNRFGLPERLPLNWASYFEAIAGSVADVGALLEEIRRKGGELAQLEKVEAAIGRAGGDGVKLQQLNTWCNSQLNLKTESSVRADASAGKQE